MAAALSYTAILLPAGPGRKVLPFSRALFLGPPSRFSPSAPAGFQTSLQPRQRSALGARCASTSPPDFKQLVKDTNASSPVVVYSKTYCPYCSEVKGLFKTLGVDANVVELNQFGFETIHKKVKNLFKILSVDANVVELNQPAEGDDIQDALYDLTGQRTVPSVFIGMIEVRRGGLRGGAPLNAVRRV